MPPRKRPRAKEPPPEDDAALSPSGSDREHADDAALLGAAARQRRRLGKAAAAGAVSTFFLPPAAGSARTLADLRVDRGDERSLRDLLARLPPRHPAEKAALRAAHQARFGRWWADLRAGNSLLLHGFGSKRDLLHAFAAECTGDGSRLEVDGLQPGLAARHVLQWAAAAARGAEPAAHRGRPAQELLDAVAAEHPRRRLYVVIHNIDGPGGLHVHAGAPPPPPPPPPRSHSAPTALPWPRDRRSPQHPATFHL